MARSKKTRTQQPPKDETQAPASAPASAPAPAPTTPVVPATPPAPTAQSRQVQTVAQQSPSESQEETPQLMQKGIYLSALVYIEGMQAPADDFAALAKSALADALSGEHKGLTITLKKSHVENNVEDTEDSGDSADKKGGFEF